MSEIAIYADSKGRGRCRSCGADVEWAEVVSSGKRMPFDPPIVAVRTQGSILEGEGRVIEIVETTVTTSHFASCPQAEQWRRKR